MRCEHGGQMFLINSERHDLSVTRWTMVHFGFDRTRDITVVTIQRNS
jgi:hypothetical protein